MHASFFIFVFSSVIQNKIFFPLTFFTHLKCFLEFSFEVLSRIFLLNRFIIYLKSVLQLKAAK